MSKALMTLGGCTALAQPLQRRPQGATPSVPLALHRWGQGPEVQGGCEGPAPMGLHSREDSKPRGQLLAPMGP